MLDLEPEADDLMAYYQAHQGQHSRIADDCRIPRFSKDLQRDLIALLPDCEAVRLVESVTRVGDFGNTDDLVSVRKAVTLQLKKRGVKMPRGKRTGPGLREFVRRVAPILLFFGLPLATSERSKLVRALQMIAAEFNIPGDPRDELRRLRKLQIAHEVGQREHAGDLLTSARKHLAPPS